ncbi:MAG: transposase [Candidatus Halalkalibacterium sp. M3_1C_030]
MYSEALLRTDYIEAALRGTKSMSFYKRNLPHWQPSGADYFVTFRLAGSLPAEAVAKIKNERAQRLFKLKNATSSSGSLPEQHKTSAGSDRLSDLQLQIERSTFLKYEALLDKADKGPIWLDQPDIANKVQEAIHYRNKKEYDLYACCLMPNHVHLVFKLIEQNEISEETHEYLVTDILKSLKWFTALKCNELLERSGQFWHSESYDRVIRDSQELENTIAYTLNNPVKAGFVENWEDWPYSYCKPEFLELFSNDT